MSTPFFDVVVVGAGIAGCCAALASSKMGARTLLVEKAQVPGGLSTLGLVQPWMRYWLDEQVLVKGWLGKISHRLKERGGLEENCLDSEALKLVLFEMLRENGVQLWLDTTPVEVKRRSTAIHSVRFFHHHGAESLVQGNTFVDASGDGVLGTLAGAQLLSGDENGENQSCTLMFTLAGVDFAAIRKDVAQNPDNFLGWVKPGMQLVSVGGYFREVEAERVQNGSFPHSVFFFVQLPGEGRVTVNTTHLDLQPLQTVSFSEGMGLAHRQVEQVLGFAKRRVKGFERAYLEKIAPVLGVRESRRLKGQVVFSGDDVRSMQHFPDGVVRGCYGIDVHPRGQKKFEVDRHAVPSYEMYYEIPFGSLLVEGFENFGVAGRCFSSDFEGQSAARIQPTCAGMGQAIGIAAALSRGGPLSSVDVDQIRWELDKLE